MTFWGLTVATVKMTVFSDVSASSLADYSLQSTVYSLPDYTAHRPRGQVVTAYCFNVS
jgi:hypothetical protein